MGALQLAATMDAIAAALVTGGIVSSGHAYAWPVEALVPGDAIVGYPEDDGIDVDMTFGRGADQAVIPVWVICGLPQDKATRDRVSVLVGSGSSVKGALDGTLSGLVSSCVATNPRITTDINAAGLALVAVRFDCEIIS